MNPDWIFDRRLGRIAVYSGVGVNKFTVAAS